MTDLFQAILKMPIPFNMIVMVCLIFAVAGVLTTIAKQIRKYGCHRQDVELKRELVDRGLSADEIERIVKVGSDSSGGKPAAAVGN